MGFNMKKIDLEHIIRACGDITHQNEFILIGSQSILGSVANPHRDLLVSMEADIYPLQAPDLADRIDGVIGEGSRFHDLFGYYAQGVGPETAVLPKSWLDRVHRIQNENTHGCVAYCLDPRDLFLSKAHAGRDKDREFCIRMLHQGYVQPSELIDLVAQMPISVEEQDRLLTRIRRWQKET